MLVSSQLCELLTSNLLSDSNPPFPVNKYTCILVHYTVCKGGGGRGSWPYRQINTFRKVPWQVNLFRWRYFALPSTTLGGIWTGGLAFLGIDFFPLSRSSLPISKGKTTFSKDIRENYRYLATFSRIICGKGCISTSVRAISQKISQNIFKPSLPTCTSIWHNLVYRILRSTFQALGNQPFSR